MRDAWEGKKNRESALDTPVTMTERDLRALRRRASTGIWALFLALISVGIALWGVLTGPEGRAQLLDLKDRILDRDQTEASAGPLARSTPASFDGPTDSIPPPPSVDSLFNGLDSTASGGP